MFIFRDYDKMRDFVGNLTHFTGTKYEITHSDTITEPDTVWVGRNGSIVINCQVKSEHFFIADNKLWWYNEFTRCNDILFDFAKNTNKKHLWDMRSKVCLIINLEMNYKSLILGGQTLDSPPNSADALARFAYYIGYGTKYKHTTNTKGWKDFISKYQIISNPLSKIGNTIRRKYKHEIHYRKTL
jgi:hypothetical protein